MVITPQKGTNKRVVFDFRANKKKLHNTFFNYKDKDNTFS